jgi:hypothetical protein
MTPEIQTDLAKENRQLSFLFCRHFGCPETEFESRVFRQCLYAQARILAPLLSVVAPHYFDRDRAFIKSLGTATGLSQVIRAAVHFRDKVGLDAGFCFNVLRIRVSGSKAIELAEESFRTQKAATRISSGRPASELFE